MTVPRFYVALPLVPQSRLALPERPAHHAVRVLRLRVGDDITLFNGQGGECSATLIAIGRDLVEAEVHEYRAIERESPLHVTLVQALSSGERMDLTVQKAVELGVTRIVPVESERSVVRLRGERADKRVAHWRSVAISACEQCGRNRIPVVEPVRSLATWLGSLKHGAMRWVLLPDAGNVLRDQALPRSPIELLVGPEGGLTAAEEQAAQQAGYLPIRLGPRVLRTETAAPALLAALQTLWGDF